MTIWNWILSWFKPPARLDKFERPYLQHLVEISQFLELRGIGLRPEDYLSTPLKLDQVYISLQFARRRGEPLLEGESARWSKNLESRLGQLELGGLDLEQSNPRIGVQQLLKQVHNRRLVILGTPGSGKTTLLKWLVLQCAKGQTRSLGLPDGVFPILLLAREVARSGIATLTPYDLGKLATTPNLLAQFGEHRVGNIFKEKLKAGQCLVLVDGLDELPSDSQRQIFARQIETLAKTFPQNWFVVTSRPAGYSSLSIPGFAVVEVSEMGQANTQEFCSNWYKALELAQLGSGNRQTALNRAQKRAAELTEAIQRHPQAHHLTTNPLLLTILALIYRNWHSLPRRRVELYERASQILLGSWFDQLKGATSVEEKRQVLSTVAYQMHSRQTRIIRTVELESHLANALADAGGHPHEAPLLLKAVQEHSGLLIELGPDLWGFSHFTFQEYLAALYLSQQPNGQQVVLEKRHHPWWRETILLYSGLNGSQNLIPELLKSDNLFHSHLLLAAQCLAETSEGGWSNQILSRLQQDIQNPAFSGLRSVGFEGLVAVAHGTLQEETLQILITLLYNHSPQIQIEAAQALGRIGLDHTDVLVNLLRKTRDDSPLLRSTAVQALGQIVISRVTINPAVTQRILELTTDPDPGVRISALLALSQFGFVAARLFPSLLSHLSDPDPTLRAAVAYSLGRLASGQPPLLKRLMALSNQPYPHIGATAAEALGHTNTADPALLKHLLALSQKPQEDVACKATLALGRVGRQNAPVVRHLFELLNHSSPRIKASAAQAIGLLGLDNPSLIRRLVELVPDSDPVVRLGAAQALGKLGPVSAEAMEKLGQRVLHSSVFVSACAADVLGQLEVARPIRDPAVLARLGELSSNPDASVRASAATALARVGQGQERVVQQLIRLCNDPDPSVQLLTLRAIGLSGWHHLDLLHHLIRLLLDPQGPVQLAAAEALGQIAEVSHELTPETFLQTQAWLQDQQPLPFPQTTPPERICDWAWKLLLSHVRATGRLGNFPDGWFGPILPETPPNGARPDRI